jgi:hypothetical protein
MPPPQFAAGASSCLRETPRHGNKKGAPHREAPLSFYQRRASPMLRSSRSKYSRLPDFASPRLIM